MNKGKPEIRKITLETEMKRNFDEKILPQEMFHFRRLRSKFVNREN